MKLTFLGTRGGIKARSNLHNKHSSLLIEYYNTKIMIDCGQDWLGKIDKINPTAIIITHAHPDHVAGLKYGTNYPVYATQQTWNIIKNYNISQKHILQANKAINFGKLKIEPFAVEHSINAPAVGYKISSKKSSIFYVPDLIAIKKPKEALYNIKLYIGDGAIVTRTLLMRRKDHTPVGHAPIGLQLSWCQEQSITNAIFTHCGSEIVKSEPEAILKVIKKLGKLYNIKATIAYDGLIIKI